MMTLQEGGEASFSSLPDPSVGFSAVDEIADFLKH